MQLAQIEGKADVADYLEAVAKARKNRLNKLKPTIPLTESEKKHLEHIDQFESFLDDCEQEFKTAKQHLEDNFKTAKAKVEQIKEVQESMNKCLQDEQLRLEEELVKMRSIGSKIDPSLSAISELRKQHLTQKNNLDINNSKDSGKREQSITKLSGQLKEIKVPRLMNRPQVSVEWTPTFTQLQQAMKGTQLGKLHTTDAKIEETKTDTKIEKKTTALGCDSHWVSLKPMDKKRYHLAAAASAQGLFVVMNPAI